jgi:hypothetical protein
MSDGSPAPVRIVRGMGGNGSTFLSRALAAQPGVLVLNECNPRSANLFEYRLNPLRQIELAEPDLAARLAALDYDHSELGSSRLFGRFVDDLTALLGADRTLVIRDYNLADFVASPLVWEGLPKSSLDAALGDRPRREIILARDPVDQFLSLRSHRALRRGLAFRPFLEGLLRMVDAFPDAPVFRYEEIFAAFDREFAGICAALDITRSAAPLALAEPAGFASGNARGRETSEPSLAPQRGEIHERLEQKPATRRLLAEVRGRTGYAAG